MEQSKACSACKATLPFSSFHKHPNGKFGLAPKCKSCIAIKDKISASKNPNRYKDNSKKFRLANPNYMTKYRLRNWDLIQITAKNWKINNPNYMADWRRANPNKVLLANTKRRSQILNNGIFDIRDKEILRLYSSKCFYCSSIIEIQADHVMPISRGGRHSIGNLVPACAKCNQSKNDLTVMEWKLRLSKRNKTI